MNELTDWHDVRNYEMSKPEEKLVQKLFREYIDANSGFEDMSSPEMSSYYEAFKHGWVMMNLVMSDE